jgi:hypothetical protein
MAKAKKPMWKQVSLLSKVAQVPPRKSPPNQLWQADIFTFRLGGKNAYLIGYIDD